MSLRREKRERVLEQGVLKESLYGGNQVWTAMASSGRESPDLLAAWDEERGKDEESSDSDESECADSSHRLSESSSNDLIDEEEHLLDSTKKAVTFQYDLISSQVPSSQEDNLENQVTNAVSSRKRELETLNAFHDVNTAELTNTSANQSMTAEIDMFKRQKVKLSGRSEFPNMINEWTKQQLKPREANLISDDIDWRVSSEQDGDLKNICGNCSATETVSLFTTGRGRGLNVSRIALQEAAKRLEDPRGEENKENTSSNAHQQGLVKTFFTTGKGKSVTITEASIKSAAQVFSEEQLQLINLEGTGEMLPNGKHSDNHTPALESLFTTGRGVSVKISESSLNAAQNRMVQSDEAMNVDDGEVMSSSLFTTGRGKSLLLKNTLVKQAQSKLEELEGTGSLSLPFQSGIHQEEDNLVVETPFSTVGENRTVRSSKQNEFDRKNFADVSKNTLHATHATRSLFTNGRGSKVHIPPAAIKAAQERLRNPKSPENSEDQIIGSGSVAQRVTPGSVLRDIKNEGVFRTPAKGGSAPFSKSSGKVSRRKGFVTPFKSGTPARQVSHDSKSSAKPSLQTQRSPYAEVGSSAFTPNPKATRKSSERKIIPASTTKWSIQKFLGNDMKKTQIAKVVARSQSHHLPEWLISELTFHNSHKIVFHPVNGRCQGFSRYNGDESRERDWSGVHNEFISTFNVNGDLATLQWTWNHFRWVVWKLACYQRIFPHVAFFRDCLNMGMVVEQLHHRYVKELERGQRPIIRKILEKDAPSTCHMVLVLCEVKDDQTLIISDGWYGMEACADPPLQELILRKKLCVGDKFHVCGAAMHGNEKGMAPLELACNQLATEGSTCQPKLLLSRNNTAPAKWETKLGAQRSGWFSKLISNIVPSPKTVVPLFEGVLVRNFPFRYCEKDTSGKWVFRDEKEEAIAQQAYEDRVNEMKEIIAIEHEKNWDAAALGSGNSSQSSGNNQENFASERALELQKAFETDPRIPALRKVNSVVKMLLQQPFLPVYVSVTVWNPHPELSACEEGSLIEVFSSSVKSQPVSQNKKETLQLTASSIRVLEASMDPRSYDERRAIPVDCIPSGCSSHKLVDTVGILGKLEGTCAFLIQPQCFVNSAIGGPYVLAVETFESFLPSEMNRGVVMALRDITFKNVDPYTGFVGCSATAVSSVLFSSKDVASRGWKHLESLYKDTEQCFRSLNSSTIQSAYESIDARLGVHAPLQPSGNSREGRRFFHEESGRLDHEPFTPNSMSTSKTEESIARDVRIQLQKQKRQEWLDRRNAKQKATAEEVDLVISPEGATELRICNESLVAVMLGKKTVDFRRATAALAKLKLKDLIKFTDGNQYQFVSVKAAIRYSSCEVAFQHEDYALVKPDAKSAEEVLAHLYRNLKPEDPILSIHFEAVTVPTTYRSGAVIASCEGYLGI